MIQTIRYFATRGALVTTIFAIAAALTSAWAKSFDPTAACVGNERVLTLALQQYVQDNDLNFPAMTSQPAFKAALLPYVPDPHMFACPETGQPYVPNAFYDHKSLPSVASVMSAPIFQDNIAHADGLKSLAFFDNVVMRGNVEQGNPDANCVQRMQTLSRAMAQYLQDYDETFPPMQNPTIWRGALRPYAGGNSRDFVCPATSELYQPYFRLTYAQYSSIPHPSSTVMIADRTAHSDGIQTKAYVDGHVTHGNLTPTLTGTCFSNEKILGLSLSMYLQDNDEQTPNMSTNATFQAALIPYAKDPVRFSCPDTGKPYIVNSSLTYKSLASFDDASTVEVLRDPNVNKDGTFNILHLDDTVFQRRGHVARSLSVEPSNKSAVLWQGSDNSALLNVISPTGTVIESAAYGPLGNALTGACLSNMKQLGLAILQYAQDYDEDFPPFDTSANLANAIAPYLRGTTSVICPETGIAYSLNHALNGKHLADLDDPANTPMLQDATPNPDGNVYTLYADGHVKGQRAVIHPVSFGATPSSIITSSAGNVALLWTGYVSQFWVLSPGLKFAGSASFGPYDGWTLAAHGGGPDQILRLLWTKYDGTAAVWMTSHDAYSSDVRLAAQPGKSAIGLVVGLDNLARVLWAGTDHTARISTVQANGSVTTSSAYGPLSGYTAQQMFVDPSNNNRILWVGSDGSASVWKVSGSTVLSQTNVTPPAGFTAISAGVGNDGLVRILFTNNAGGARIYVSNDGGSVIRHNDYNPS